MRKLIIGTMGSIVMSLSLSVVVFADGDLKSMMEPAPPPPVVEAPQPPVAAAVSPEPSLPPMAEAPAAAMGPVAPVRSEGFGADVRYWVATQVSGVSSVTDQRPLQGEVAKRAYERYLKSFEYPIPETFKREGFNNGSSGTSTR